MENTSFSMSGFPTQPLDIINQLVNLLMAEGYSQDKADTIARSREAWRRNRTTNTTDENDTYHVIPHPLGWVVSQLNGANPCVVFTTCEEAIQIAKEVARINNRILVVHRDNGEILQ